MIIVTCHNFEDGVVEVIGPFEDLSWAQAWIKQHDHNPYDQVDTSANTLGLFPGEVEEFLEKTIEDVDHWCSGGQGTLHDILTLAEPGFDPTTLPRRI